MVGDDAQMFLTGPAHHREGHARGRDGGRARRPARAPQDRRLAPRGRRRRRGRATSCATRSSYFPGKAGGRCRSRDPADPPAGRSVAPVPTNQRKVYDVRDVITPPARRRRASSSSASATRTTWSSASGASTAIRSASSPTSRATSAARWTPPRRTRARGSWTSATTSGSRSSCSPTRPASGPACARSARRCCAAAPTCCARSRSRRCPRVTVTLRQAYGGAYIVMNCRDLGHDLTLRLAQRQDRRHGRDAGDRDRASAASWRPAPTPPSWPPPTRRSTCRSRSPRRPGSSTRSSTPAKTRERIAAHFEARR